MSKYVISSGTATVSELNITDKISEVRLTNQAKQAIKYNTIGEAMQAAVEVNKILNSHAFHAISL